MEYLIWSNEHNAWWCPNSRGYTQFIELAGIYTIEEATKICNDANYDWNMDKRNKIPNELPILREAALLLKAQPNSEA